MRSSSTVAAGVFAVTAEMTIRFLRPVATGEKIRFTGRVVAGKGRIFITEGEALGEDGQPFATAKGKYREARPDLKAQLMKSIDS